jgi:regulator of cell morphogenesis and NO signaling
MIAANGSLREITVNEFIRRYPETIQIFNEFNIDACCGGGVPLKEAAERDGVDTTALFTALIDAIGCAA